MAGCAFLSNKKSPKHIYPMLETNSYIRGATQIDLNLVHFIIY